LSFVGIDVSGLEIRVGGAVYSPTRRSYHERSLSLRRLRGIGETTG
jgi:hypothetical protein